MKGLTTVVPEYLPKTFQNYHFGETKWVFQLYYGRDRRIHYEVARTSNQKGRVLEVGLHFESRDKSLNQLYIEHFQRYIFEIREALGEQVVAERWDRGWSKIYEAHPSESLTKNDQHFVGERLATFIEAIQPLYEHIRARV